MGIVPKVHTTGIVYRLVLAHENNRNALSKLSEDALRRIDMVPHASVGQGSLRGYPGEHRSFRLDRKRYTFPIACDILTEPENKNDR